MRNCWKKIMIMYFFLLLFAKDSKNPKKFNIGFWEVGEKRLLIGVRNTNTKKNLLIKAKFAQNKLFLRENFTPFISRKVFKSEPTSFHYFSPRIRNL